MFLQRTYFTYIMIGSIAFFMFKEFYFYMPSHSYTENIVKISKHLLILSTCFAYFVALITKEPGLMFLNVITIFPLLVIITVYKLNARLGSLHHLPIFTVNGIDRNIRYNKKYEKMVNFDSFIEDMYDKFGNDFELCLLESRYYSEVFKNHELSMLKLSKIYFFPNFILRHNILAQIEIKFKFYSQFEFLVSNLKLITQSAVEKALKMRSIKETDLKTSFLILKFLEHLSFDNKMSGMTFLKNCEELANSLEVLGNDYRAMIKEFPAEKELVDLYRSLMHAMNRTSEKLERRKFKTASNFNSQAFRNCEIPLVVINADPLSMGKIIFMNHHAKRALDYDNECKHLTKLVPFISKNDLKCYLKNLIMESTKLVHVYPYMCLEKNKGGSILVKMTMNITWYNLKPYIIITFMKHKKDKVGILYSDNGRILSGQSVLYELNLVSEKIREIEKVQDYRVSLLLVKNISLGFIKFGLPIYQNKVKMLMLFEDNKALEEINSHFDNLEIQSNLENSDQFKKRKANNRSNLTILTNRQDTNKEEPVDRQSGFCNSAHESTLRKEKMKSIKKSIHMFIRPIKIGLIVALVIYTISSISVILITHFGIREIVSNIAIDELGKMRALTQLISISTRSLYLLSEGYEMEYSEEHYRSQLGSTSKNLRDLVLRFQDGVVIDLFLEEDLFTTNTVHVFDKLEGQLYKTKVPLSEGLKKLTDYSTYLNSNPLQNMTHHYYILRNGPNDLLTVLNDTVYQALQHTVSRIDMLEYIYDLLCILVFVPSILLIIFVTPSVKYLEKINQLLSDCFRKIHSSSIVDLGSQIQERLILKFDLEEVFEFGHKLNENKLSMWKIWRYTFLLIIGVSGISYIILTFVYPSQIFSIINQQPVHDFWYGYARMIPVRTYFWTREAFLHFEDHNSYNQLFPESSPIADYIGKTIDVSEEYKFLFQNLRYRLKDTYTHSLDDAMQVFYGKACIVMGNSIADCEKTIVANGLASGMLDYISFVRAAAEMSGRDEIDYQTIKKLERNSSILNSVAGKLMSIVTTSSERILFDLIEKQIVLSIFVFISLGVFIVFVVKKGLLRIGDRLIAKYVLITIVDEKVFNGFFKSLNKVSTFYD